MTRPALHVLVTGASAGIGAATAIAYGRRAASVTLVARRSDRLRDVASAVERAGGRASVAPADVADRQACLRAVHDALGTFGPVDVLVNNAGMPGGAPFDQIDVARVEQVTAVNWTSALRFAHAVLPSMLERRYGAIVNVASVAGRIGVPGAGPYAATKHALAGWSEALRLECAPRGVRVILCNPGPVRTESFPHSRAPRWAVLEPDAIARAIVRAVDRDTAEVTVPRYYRAITVLGAVAPPVYRSVLRAFSGRSGG